ncbi:MAG: hypothetical protein ACRC14_07730 [Paracoccaceae bacterium]
MIRRMTTAEALIFLEQAFNIGPDMVSTGMVEAIVAGSDAQDAAEALDAYCKAEIGEIEPDSVTFRADRTYDGDMTAVQIIIKTEV